ncbi:MAG TPA: hypothetical protein PKH77_28375 [Anaerolineae bacterium]|nr:hypothetical protein [Anaerolineae bacterium]
MQVTDVSVHQLGYMAGLKGPEIKALVQLTLSGTQPQFVWVELAVDEYVAAYDLARAIEARLAAHPESLPEDTKPIGFKTE